jgi:hypothetical protein
MTRSIRHFLEKYAAVLKQPQGFCRPNESGDECLHLALERMWVAKKRRFVLDFLRSVRRGRAWVIENRIDAALKFALLIASRRMLSEHEKAEAMSCLRWALQSCRTPLQRVRVLNRWTTLLRRTDPQESLQAAMKAVRILRDGLASARRQGHSRAYSKYLSAVPLYAVDTLRNSTSAVSTCTRLLKSFERQLSQADIKRLRIRHNSRYRGRSKSSMPECGTG